MLGEHNDGMEAVEIEQEATESTEGERRSSFVRFWRDKNGLFTLESCVS